MTGFAQERAARGDRRVRSSITGPAVLAVLGTGVLAGPEFVEDDFGDAGSLPGTAIVIPGGMGTSGAIVGSLGGPPMPGPPDFEDLYVIEIVDVTEFSAETIVEPGQTDFDTQLWLFTEEGLPLLGNDDSPIDPASEGSLLLPMTTDGFPVDIQPGFYLLGISGAGNVPQSSGGDLFEFTEKGEISGPDGPGAAEVLSAWSGAGATGTYAIFLTGVSFPEAPACPEDLDRDGDVDTADLLILLEAWGPCDAPCPPACTGDLDGSCDVATPDLLGLLETWGPC